MKRIPIALLLIAIVIPFIRLGTGEMLPWDESLFAVRADACLMFGAWLDQAKYAVGGLYSACHPPIGVWLIAFSKFLFGSSTFTTRLPLAAAAAGSIILLWFFLHRFVTREAVLVAIASLSASDLFLLYSQRAQMEVLILFFGIACIYSLSISIENNRWMLAIVSGILFGLGLLTKLGYMQYIVPFALLLPWALKKMNGYKYVVAMLGIGSILFFPWLMQMMSKHPDFWEHARSSLETLQQGTYDSNSRAWWYYWNRLIVALPAILIVFSVRKPNRMQIAAGIWLLTVLLVLQSFQTRMPHFSALLLAPGSVLIGLCWDRVSEIVTISKRWLLRFILLAAIGWSASVQLRLWLTHRIAWSDIQIPSTGIIIAIFGAALAIILFLKNPSPKRFAISIAILLMGLAVAHPFSIQEGEVTPGASFVGSIAASLPEKQTMVVIHRDFPHDEYAPQIAYYTNGWTLGWIPGKTSRTITWDSATTNAYSPDSSKEIAVVARFEDRYYHRPVAETLLWNSLMEKLRRNFSHERVFRSYFMFY